MPKIADEQLVEALKNVVTSMGEHGSGQKICERFGLDFDELNFFTTEVMGEEKAISFCKGLLTGMMLSEIVNNDELAEPPNDV